MNISGVRRINNSNTNINCKNVSNQPNFGQFGFASSGAQERFAKEIARCSIINTASEALKHSQKLQELFNLIELCKTNPKTVVTDALETVQILDEKGSLVKESRHDEYRNPLIEGLISALKEIMGIDPNKPKTIDQVIAECPIIELKRKY